MTNEHNPVIIKKLYEKLYYIKFISNIGINHIIILKKKSEKSMKKQMRQWYEKLHQAELLYIRSAAYNIRIGVQWIFMALITGAVVGTFSGAFAWCLQRVTQFRMETPEILYALPFGGLLIVFLYQKGGLNKDPGTNVLLSAVHEQDKDVPVLLAPLIFVATLITHLCGGSAGREGAALQMGGSIGNTLGRLFRLKEGDRKIIVMSGMSAAFSAVFGTPLAAAIFPMEMISVGIMQYSALLPCVFSAFVANQCAATMGISPEAFSIGLIPGVTVKTSVKVILLGVGCALVSILFCAILRCAGSLYNRYFKNPYIKVLAGGVLFVLLVKLLGTTQYCGAGAELIEQAIEGECDSYAFLLKIILTAVTLAAGYKGGEIVPAFTAGATFGCLFGQIMEVSPSMCAAIGMISVFCGVTNCPIASMLIGFELFGFGGAGFFLISISVSYLFSGYRGLYKEQIIVYSKYHPKYINRMSGEESFSGSDYED